MSDDLFDAQPSTPEPNLYKVRQTRRNRRNDPLPDPLVDAFEEFWRAYPRKIRKKDCKLRYVLAVEAGADPAAILASAQAFREFCVDTAREEQFIRHPLRWLAERPWEEGEPFINRPRYIKAKSDSAVGELSSPSTCEPAPRPVEQPQARKPLARVPVVVVPTVVYRLLARDGILLYVGVSSNVEERMKAHQREKPWWHLVEHVDIRTESAYGDFFVDEYEACLNEFPVFNVDLVPWRCWRPSTGNKAFDRVRDRADIAGAVARLDDAGVRGRLDALRKAFRGTYETAVAVVGLDVWPDETWRRMVLVAAEERYLDFEKKPPRERGLKRKFALNGGGTR